MDRETANKVAETLEEVNKLVFGLLPLLEEKCSEEELKKIKREIGRLSACIDMDFYPLILNQYPELNPLKNKH